MKDNDFEDLCSSIKEAGLIKMIELKEFLIVALLFICFSCTYDNVEELYGEKECPPGGTSFSQTIAPIISLNCAISGCHVNGQQLPTLITYKQISMNSSKSMGPSSAICGNMVLVEREIAPPSLAG